MLGEKWSTKLDLSGVAVYPHRTVESAHPRQADPEIARLDMWVGRAVYGSVFYWQIAASTFAPGEHRRTPVHVAAAGRWWETAAEAMDVASQAKAQFEA